MAHKILVVDDELTLAGTLRAYLEAEGYEVEIATEGDAALHAFKTFHPDLLILDIMLPKMDGLEVLRRVRQTSDIYVIMLTAKADETDKIVGLTVGADDYVTKPFSPRELVARVKAAFRRLEATHDRSEELISRRVRLDVEGRLVWRGGELVELTPIEFDLLAVLMRHHGRVLSREQLLEHVWGFDYFGDDRLVDIHISRLRKKLDVEPGPASLIGTVWGVGYRFEDEAG